MKKIILLFTLVLSIVLPAPVFAQPGYITTIAGNGTSGYGADGVLATATNVGQSSAVFVDGSGNVYFDDSNATQRIRCISPGGIVTTFAGGGSSAADGIPATNASLGFFSKGSITADAAGNILFVDSNRIRSISVTSGIITTVAGTTIAGFSGDGGPATAAQLYSPLGICVDLAGNIYIGDKQNHRIRKIAPSGIISTFAGTGVNGYSGDGGPATAAKLNCPAGLCADNSGNIYVADCYNSRIRKIDASGTITTYAGSASSGFAGDGGPATTAKLNYPFQLAIDLYGNIYIADYANNRVRMVAPTGIISTFAGGGSSLLSGVAATAASLSGIRGICIDASNNLYIADNNHFRLCKTGMSVALASADSFNIFCNDICSGSTFTVTAPYTTTSYNQTTFFGDGTSFSSPITSGYSGTAGFAAFTHIYTLPGTYTAKTILYNGTSVADSTTYTYHVRMCNMLQTKFYIDNNSSLSYESSFDNLSYYPLTVEIDSNGLPIDTLTTTSGFYYSAYGVPGDIYAMKIIATIPGLASSSPTSGILYDTLQTAAYSGEINYFGLSCSTPGNNLRIHSANRCGAHRYGGDLLVDNLFCSPTGSATVTLSISPKYQYQSCNIAPTSVSGNTLTWNLTGLTTASTPIHIQVTGEKPSGSTSYLPGDTVHSYGIIGPWTGDTDTTDNVTNPVDTVKSGYDPNFIDVTPKGYIPSGTQLEYTIGFENTGNDTAFNIYVLDTLSDDLDPSTLSIVTASAAMDIYKFTAGGHTIVKFDFPHINLLDSSYHNLCHGMLAYTIKTRNGLPDCTHIPARAGIYFDMNPVVMTNTIENIIGPPPVYATITGTSALCTGDVTTLLPSVPGGTWSVSNTNATVLGGTVTAVANGPVFVYYTMPAACGPITSQFLINIGAPSPGFILSPSSVCAGSSISIAGSVAGGSWSVYNGNASLSGTTLTGVIAGIDTLYYTISSACGNSVAQQTISIDTIVIPTSILGSTTVCEGSSITMSNITAGGVWSLSNTIATVSTGGIVTGVTAGSVQLTYTITNGCGSNATTIPITVVDCSHLAVNNTAGTDGTIQIFPNPANDQLTIQTTALDYQTIMITNNIGQTLLQSQVKDKTTLLSVATLPPGLYYITLKSNNGTVVRKFVKM